MLAPDSAHWPHPTEDVKKDMAAFPLSLRGLRHGSALREGACALGHLGGLFGHDTSTDLPRGQAHRPRVRKRPSDAMFPGSVHSSHRSDGRHGVLRVLRGTLSPHQPTLCTMSLRIMHCGATADGSLKPVPGWTVCSEREIGLPRVVDSAMSESGSAMQLFPRVASFGWNVFCSSCSFCIGCMRLEHDV